MSTTTTSTIRALPERDQTATPQIVREQVLGLRAQAALQRDQLISLTDDAGTLHDTVQDLDLQTRSSTLIQQDPQGLLSQLGDNWGFPWSLVATLTGVSAPAVRKWRRGGALTVDNRLRLARLVAFCQILQEIEPLITDVPLYLQSPVAPGLSSVTPVDLLVDDYGIALLNRATGRATVEELLNEGRPDWRESTRPDTRHRVIIAPDGQPAIVQVD